MLRQWLLAMITVVAAALSFVGVDDAHAVVRESPYTYDASSLARLEVVVATTARSTSPQVSTPSVGEVERSTATRWSSTTPTLAVVATNRSLAEIANEIREAGLHPAARNNRTIAVGIDSSGRLFVGSSHGLDAGQRAAADRLGVTRVPGSGSLHAEEELLRAAPDLCRVGTSVRAPCGPTEHNCAAQLDERGIEVD